MPIWHLWIVHVARCSQMTIVRTHIASDMAVAADRCAKALAVRQSTCGDGLLQLQRDMASTKRGGNPAGA
jgi:hypothetical protein